MSLEALLALAYAIACVAATVYVTGLEQWLVGCTRPENTSSGVGVV